MTDKILIVDDDVHILNAVKRELHKIFAIEIAQSGAEGLQKLKNDGPFAVVISDMRMPNMDGLEFLIQVKQKFPDTIRIMLTADSDQQLAVDAVNKGNIYRFLNKPWKKDMLVQCIQDGLEQYHSISSEHELLAETLEHSKQLEEEVIHDGLTGLYNKKYFMKKIEEEYQNIQKNGGESHLIFIDIDFFKKINDTYSHPAGDYVLKSIGDILKNNFGKTDIIARYGGEEFVVLSPNTPLNQAEMTAEKLRQTVESHKFEYNKQQIPVTLSVGIANFSKGSSLTEVIDHADQALYKAKREGRNRVCRS